jgi:serine/tyrosine/threonine adenylyltransferase
LIKDTFPELISPYFFLNEKFYDEVQPASFPNTIIRYKNNNFNEFKNLSDEDWISFFGLFNHKMLPIKKNLAMRYHGHQFRVYNPDIGDGRGFTIAQFYKGEKLYDLGTKGSGITPYSRGGDGRLTLKGGVREVLCSGYLDAQGVNSSQSLSLIETGENLIRNDEPSPTRSSILVRVSHSHIRIGTFQYHAYHQDHESLDLLMKSVGKYYLSFEEKENTPINFFSNVVERSAKLAASYHISGFVHGVLNTDNINVTGESFDYGPYRFMEKYDPQKVAAYFDYSGLYKFSNQTDAFFWNLQQLASIMTIFLEQNDIIDELKKYVSYYNKEVISLFFKKLLLKPSEDLENNQKFLNEFYQILSHYPYLYEEIFYDLRGGRQNKRFQKEIKIKYKDHDLEKIFCNQEAIIDFDYLEPFELETLLYEEIEKIWFQIDKNDDWSLFNKKINSINEYKNKLSINGLG